jgi:hypothetical protein
MTTAVTAPSISPTPALVSASQAAVVEVPDDDTPPPGWDHWGSLPVKDQMATREGGSE